VSPAIDYSRELSEYTICHCGEKHPPAYRLRKCAADGCTVEGCYVCLSLCESCNREERYCFACMASIPCGKKSLLVCPECKAEEQAEQELLRRMKRVDGERRQDAA